MKAKIVIEETASGFAIEMRGSGMAILGGLAFAIAEIYKRDRRDDAKSEEFAMAFAKTLVRLIEDEAENAEG